MRQYSQFCPVCKTRAQPGRRTCMNCFADLPEQRNLPMDYIEGESHQQPDKLSETDQREVTRLEREKWSNKKVCQAAILNALIVGIGSTIALLMFSYFMIRLGFNIGLLVLFYILCLLFSLLLVLSGLLALIGQRDLALLLLDRLDPYGAIGVEKEGTSENSDSPEEESPEDMLEGEGSPRGTNQ